MLVGKSMSLKTEYISFIQSLTSTPSLRIKIFSTYFVPSPHYHLQLAESGDQRLTWPGLRGPAVTTDQTEADIPPTDQWEASGASAVTRLCFRVRSWDTTQHDTTLPIWHLIVSDLLHSLMSWSWSPEITDIWWWWAVWPESCCSQADQAEWPWQGWAHPPGLPWHFSLQHQERRVRSSTQHNF